MVQWGLGKLQQDLVGFLKSNTMKQTNALTRALKNQRGHIAVILSQDIKEGRHGFL